MEIINPRSIVVGYGTQGKKRKNELGKNCVAVVDPISKEANYKQVQNVPVENYDVAFVCTPDDEKFEIIKYLISNSKNVLCEKPLWFIRSDDYDFIEEISNTNGVSIYTAYNHRFEESIIKVRDVLSSKLLGDIYLVKINYGNGTAKQVANSSWRDQGLGVLKDLGSHCLDLARYWLPEFKQSFRIFHYDHFENKSPDFGFIISETSKPRVLIEVSLCSWKNNFMAEIVCQGGTLKLNGLSKWGDSTLTIQKRVFPSGVPSEKIYTFNQGDETWRKEQEYFFSKLSKGEKVDLSYDREIFQTLNKFKLEYYS